MEKFRKNLTVDIHDVDYNGVARASALMRYIQSAAQSQLTENGEDVYCECVTALRDAGKQKNMNIEDILSKKRRTTNE